MTRNELAHAIEEYIGMTGEIEDGTRGTWLHFRSQRGVTLVSIRLYHNVTNDSWSIGAISGGLPDSWDAICDLSQL